MVTISSIFNTASPLSMGRGRGQERVHLASTAGCHFQLPGPGACVMPVLSLAAVFEFLRGPPTPAIAGVVHFHLS